MAKHYTSLSTQQKPPSATTKKGRAPAFVPPGVNHSHTEVWNLRWVYRTRHGGSAEALFPQNYRPNVRSIPAFTRNVNTTLPQWEVRITQVLFKENVNLITKSSQKLLTFLCFKCCHEGNFSYVFWYSRTTLCQCFPVVLLCCRPLTMAFHCGCNKTWFTAWAAIKGRLPPPLWGA